MSERLAEPAHWASEVAVMAVVGRDVTSSTVDDVPGPAPDLPQLGRSRVGVLFSVMWLFFLLDPLRDAWRAPDPLQRWLAVTALLAFAATFAGSFGVWRHRRALGRPPRPGAVWPVMGLMLVLIALATPAIHQEALAGFVYVAVTAAMMLPLPQAAGTLAALVAASLVLPRVLDGWASADDLVPELVLASIAAYGISQVLLRNGQLAQARQQLVELAVTAERERLARDVHDILGHSLTVITVKAELAGRLLESAQPGPAVDRARSEVADLEQLARGALADVRATVAGTREMSLAVELAAARQALLAAGIEVDLPATVEQVPPSSRELFAWVLREGVTNVVRHADAHWCGVQLTADCIQVDDDGRGPGAESCGTGLAGLRARAAAAGARLEIGMSARGGFSLRVVLR